MRWILWDRHPAGLKSQGLAGAKRRVFTLPYFPRYPLNLQILLRAKIFARKHPRLVTAMAAGPIAPLGDFICQHLEIWRHSARPPVSATFNSVSAISASKEPLWAAAADDCTKKRFDWKRFGAAAVFGACVSAPVGVWWFPWVDRVLKVNFPSIVEGSVAFVMAKTVAEGVLIGPPFTISYFCIVSAIQGGEKWETLIPRMKRDIVATNIADQAWWLLVAPINYKYVPVSSQVFFANVATALELMAFSWIQHNRGVEPTAMGPRIVDMADAPR
jgi:hypothetical protein